MFRAVLFDFDYTLIDASVGIDTSVNFTLTSNGLPERTNDEIEATVGMTIEDIFIYFTGSNDMEFILKLCRDFSDKADEVMAPGTSFLPDTIDVLSKLRQKGIMTGIVTSKTKKMVKDVFTPRGYSHLLDCIIGCDTVPNAKPAPDGIIKAADELGIPLEEVLYVGDSVYDAKAAMNAGVSYAGVTTGRTSAVILSSFPNLAVAPSLTDAMKKVFGDDF